MMRIKDSSGDLSINMFKMFKQLGATPNAYS